MRDPVEKFLSQFLDCAADAAETKYGDRNALSKLFNGTAYSQRRKEWFPSDGAFAPSRTMGRQDFDILKSCIASANGVNGSGAVDGQVLEHLSRMYVAYLDGMRQLDARRARHLTARSLTKAAATARIDRLMMAHGSSIRHLGDKDCFSEIVEAEQRRAVELANPKDAVAIAQAFCRLLNSPGPTIQDERLRTSYLLRVAGLGIWSSWHIGLNCSISYSFTSILKDENAKRRSSLSSFLMTAKNLYSNKNLSKEYFDVLDIDVDNPPLEWSLYHVYPGFLLGEVAYAGCIAGLPLAAKSDLLRGRSPEQSFQEGFEAAMLHGAGVYACITQVIFAKFLGLRGQVDDGWSVLNEARRHAASFEDRQTLLELRFAESETILLGAHWLRERTDKSLADYAVQTERAAGLAESLHLPLRAQELRVILAEALEKKTLAGFELW